MSVLRRASEGSDAPSLAAQGKGESPGAGRGRVDASDNAEQCNARGNRFVKFRHSSAESRSESKRLDVSRQVRSLQKKANYCAAAGVLVSTPPSIPAGVVKVAVVAALAAAALLLVSPLLTSKVTHAGVKKAWSDSHYRT